ncbi:hypothetical protein BBJ28_00023087 [Nothophytophthora sp. Chile5]|nr:hypothetical protein BBJ28_00023087 [Nothophytophthora sp. Chile5]
MLATAGALAWATRDDPELMTAVIAAMFKKSLEERLVVPDVRFNIDNLSNAEAALKLRFTGAEVKRLAVAFCLPDVIITPQNVRIGGVEALCIVLRRMCFPNRLKELTMEFGRHWTLLSSIINQTIGLLYDRFKIKLDGFYLYGDPAYPLTSWLISPVKQRVLSDAESAFNRSMSRSRVTVEWCFGQIVRYWAFLDFKKQHKIFLSPVAKYYLTGTLLTNAITCLHGSQVASFFDCAPPSLEEYLEF